LDEASIDCVEENSSPAAIQLGRPTSRWLRHQIAALVGSALAIVPLGRARPFLQCSARFSGDGYRQNPGASVPLPHGVDVPAARRGAHGSRAPRRQFRWSVVFNDFQPLAFRNPFPFKPIANIWELSSGRNHRSKRATTRRSVPGCQRIFSESTIDLGELGGVPSIFLPRPE
jgi:hypothetical protein